ncbi:thymidylate kinase [Haloarcula virus HCTV-16]|nr:thymidylate kinase [Haloarcula virus HCTV-16]
MSEGTFITVEGIDGAGKTSVTDAIEEEFDVVRTQEPSELWTGKQVRRALTEDTPPFTDFFLFMADRHLHIETQIKPALAEGKLVISDRFTDSTLAYQPVQLMNELEDPQQWMKSVMSPWNIEPDATIYLNVTLDTALDRLDGVEKYERVEMLEQVKANYELLRRENFERYRTIDADQTEEEVISDALRVVKEVVDE